MPQELKPSKQMKIAEDFDYFANEYEDNINAAISFGGNEHQFYIDVKRNHLIHITEETFAKNEDLDVLDLGCGIGVYHKGLEGCYRELHGAEISSQSIKIAEKAHPWVNYAHYDGLRLPYETGQFDVVFTICVMHHVPPERWYDFTTEMHRVLKPGGLAIVFEHNPYNPATQYIVRNCEIDKDAVLLTPCTLRSIFRDTQFLNIKTRTILSVPPKGRFLSSVDMLLGNLPFGAQYYLSARKE